MSHCRIVPRGALVAAVAVGLASVARAEQPPASQPDIAQEIGALRARIDRLEAEQKAQRAAAQELEQQSSVDQALRDADRHSQLFDSVGFTGGFNRSKTQFFLASEDGNFYFHPGIYAQVRGIVNDRQKAKKNNTDDTEVGFEIRRVKFYFDGNLFTPDLIYKFQWQDSTAGGAPTLEYAWAQYTFLKKVGGVGDVAVRAGQFKDIVFKEEFTGDHVQVMVERSLANTLVGGNAPPSNLTQGVDFLWLGMDNPVHDELLLHDGYGSALTTFGQPHGTPVAIPQTPVNPPVNPPYSGAAARVDFKPFGDWADTTDFTGVNSGKKDLLDIGAGLDYTSAQAQNAIRYTVDGQYQVARKITLFAAGYGDYFQFRDLKAGQPRYVNNFGGVIEGGYDLTNAWQLTARYDISRLDPRLKPSGLGNSTLQEISVGANWFGPHGDWGNHAKFSIDLNWLPNGSVGAGGLDYLVSPTVKFHSRQEIVLRSQVQIWF